MSKIVPTPFAHKWPKKSTHLIVLKVCNFISPLALIQQFYYYLVHNTIAFQTIVFYVSTVK